MTRRTSLGLFLAGPEYTGDEWDRILGQLASDVPIEDFQRHKELRQLFSPQVSDRPALCHFV